MGFMDKILTKESVEEVKQKAIQELRKAHSETNQVEESLKDVYEENRQLKITLLRTKYGSHPLAEKLIVSLEQVPEVSPEQIQEILRDLFVYQEQEVEKEAENYTQKKDPSAHKKHVHQEKPEPKSFEALEAHVLALKQKGWQNKRIKKEVGIGGTSLQAILSWHGIIKVKNIEKRREQMLRVQELYDKGLSYDAIAKEVGIIKPNIATYIRRKSRTGFWKKSKELSGQRLPKLTKWVDQTVQTTSKNVDVTPDLKKLTNEVIQLHLKGVSVPEISKALKIPYYRVAPLLALNGYSVGGKNAVDAQLVKKAQSLYDGGMSSDNIANEINVPRGSVHRYIPLKNRGRGKTVGAKTRIKKTVKQVVSEEFEEALIDAKRDWELSDIPAKFADHNMYKVDMEEFVDRIRKKSFLTEKEKVDSFFAFVYKYDNMPPMLKPSEITDMYDWIKPYFQEKLDKNKDNKQGGKQA